MAEGEEIKEFPDVQGKLAAPKKLSAFERDRQAVEAKRQRAEAENAAALKAFQDSFGGDDDDDGDMLSRMGGGGRGAPSGPRGGSMGSRGRGGWQAGAGRGGSGMGLAYDQTLSGPKSGPGSLGPMPGPPMKKKRALDEMRDDDDAAEPKADRPMLHRAHFASQQKSRLRAHSGHGNDSNDDGRAPKKTILLSSLPLSTTEKDIRALLQDHLKVHSVGLLFPTARGSFGMKSMSSVVVLDSAMEKAQVDGAVAALKDRYLGGGCCLSISRHHASTSLHQPHTVMGGISNNLAGPFGAIQQQQHQGQMSRNFAPPTSYNPGGPQRHGPMAQSTRYISVQPPSDIQTTRAIHVIVDRLLSESDSARALQLEAMLMAQPKIKNDERFSFLYDTRSAAGVYYRWLLWRDDGKERHGQDRIRGIPEKLFADVPVEWSDKRARLPFMDLTNLADTIDHEDYDSSEEEQDDEERERQFNTGKNNDNAPSEAQELQHLNPLQRARLVHLLSRLPNTHTLLRRGDVARITNFAITHAGRAANEIVDLLLFNLIKPISTVRDAERKESLDPPDREADDEGEGTLPTPDVSSPARLQNGSKRAEDPAGTKLVGLFVISDVFSAASTAGARGAWKYRSLFEAGFRKQKIFQRLGRLEKELGWGRLRGEQWKRRVENLLGIWERWSVFSTESQAEFKKDFFTPPLTEAELEAKRQADEAAIEARRKSETDKAAQIAAQKKADFERRFKRVGSPSSENQSKSVVDDIDGEPMDDIDGEPMDDIDGEPMDDIDGEPMDDIDGEPMDDMDKEQKPAEAPEEKLEGDLMPSNSDEIANVTEPAAPTPGKISMSLSTPGVKGKRRMRAEDLFD